MYRPIHRPIHRSRSPIRYMIRSFFTQKEASNRCPALSGSQTSDPLHYIANWSQFLSSNVLWSGNVHRHQPERSEIFMVSGLPLSRRSNREKLTTADILTTFAGEFFYRRNRRHRVAMLFKLKSVLYTPEKINI